MTQHNRPIQIFVTDNAKEYSTKSVQLFYGQAGIRYFTTVPHTPEENSVAGRLKRTFFERARASLLTAFGVQQFLTRRTSTINPTHNYEASTVHPLVWR